MIITGILLTAIGGIIGIIFLLTIVSEIITTGFITLGLVIILSLCISAFVVGIYLIKKGKIKSKENEEIIKLKKELEIEKYKKELENLKKENTKN